MKEQSLAMRRIGRRAVFRGLSGTALGALLATGVRLPVGAAAGFADPAFEAQWRAGEAIAPNFWGPLSTATGAILESYREAAGGQRLVQYFDKGRMELTNGAVTNGLLAREIITGKMQTGTASYEDRPAPAIPIAGDTDNPGPTYAMLSGKASGLLLAAPARIGALVTATVAADGTLSTGNPAGGDLTAISVYDEETKHNVPRVFAEYRSRTGIAAIGLAIAEPFATTVKVGGAAKMVLVQPFERRVLTYTADNPPPFQVEMGNIGQHYLRWRYSDTPPVAAAPPATPNGQLDAEEADCLARINAYRAQNNLPPLTLNASLTRTAKWLSGDMAAKGYFSHTDSLGRDLTARLQAFGVTGNTSWGENIAAGNASAAETFLQWKNSPEHDANMLRATFTTIGIGRAQGAGPYGWYWTTDFGNA